jgi:cytochrome P450
LGFAVFNLLDAPEWKSKLLKELDEAIPDVNVLPSTTDLERLPVLTAVVKETLRHSLHITNRVQMYDPAVEMQYQSWTIPKNTPVSMDIPRLHRDARFFKDPNTWNPGRFLGEEAALANKYYMPFHRGFRNCVGQKWVIFSSLCEMKRD